MKSSKFLEALKVPLFILKFAGLWDRESVKATYKVLQFCMHLMTCEISILLQLIYLFTTKNLINITDLLSVLLLLLVFTIKSLHFLKKRKAVEALIEEAKELAALVETDHEKSLQALNNRAEKMNIVFLGFLYSGLFTILIWLVITITTNVIDPNPPYKTPFKMWLPFGCENNFHCSNFATTIQTMLATITAATLVSVENLPNFFNVIGTGFLEELGERLSRVCDEGKTDKMAMKEFEKCIAIHIKIKTFVKKFENIFSIVVCVQGSMSVVILCSVVFQLSEVSFEGNFLNQN
jgi:7tm Odorant receptor